MEFYGMKWREGSTGNKAENLSRAKDRPTGEHLEHRIADLGGVRLIILLPL